MKKNAQPKARKRTLKVKDLALKGSATKNIKGGVIGPCQRSRR